MLWLKQYWLHLVIAVGVAYFLIAAYGKGYTAGRTEVLADWTASQLVAEQAVRQLESTWQDRVATARVEADEKVQAINVTAGRVVTNNDRLHVAALDRAKRNACKDPTATESRRDSGLLLASVLDRVGKRTGELAAYADRLRVEAEECRAAWPR